MESKAKMKGGDKADLVQGSFGAEVKQEMQARTNLFSLSVG